MNLQREEVIETLTSLEEILLYQINFFYKYNKS